MVTVRVKAFFWLASGSSPYSRRWQVSRKSHWVAICSIG